MLKKIISFLFVISLITTTNITAFAAEFTPSVESKPAPEIVMQTDSSGKECAAIVYDANGREITGVPNGDLVVTPVSAAGTSTTEIADNLNSAYEQLQSVNSLTDLSKELETVIKEISPEISVNDLVVRDLFDVSITGHFEEYLNQEGNYISVRFKLSADSESLAAVLRNIEDTTWETVTNDRITRNKDYTVDVIFYDLSPVAFLFDAGQLEVDPDAPNSPQTGEPVSYAVIWVVAGITVVLVSTYIIKKRHSSQKI